MASVVVGRGRLESLSQAVRVSATMSVAFDAHGPWCTFVEYRMSNVEYQANFTHVY